MSVAVGKHQIEQQQIVLALDSASVRPAAPSAASIVRS